MAFGQNDIKPFSIAAGFSLSLFVISLTSLTKSKTGHWGERSAIGGEREWRENRRNSEKLEERERCLLRSYSVLATFPATAAI